MPNYTKHYGTTGGISGATYQFGIADTGAVDGMALESLTISQSPEFEAEAKNDEGMTAAYVKGDMKAEFSASGFLIDAALFQAVTNFTFTVDGVSRYFIIQNKSTSDSNTEFKKAEITGISFKNVTAEA